MCGISGIINNETNQYQAKDLLAMTKIITHRGPDDEGYYIRDNTGGVLILGGDDTSNEAYHTDVAYCPADPISKYANQQIKVALGHRRLSIIDLSPFGHLPMCSSNQRYWITFNGEIYNYKTIKKELQSLGHQFISNSDTEVILAAYSQWGQECLHHFNGMWAFAIYDSDTKEVFLARDRFGIKPLYYWISGNGTFCFGSEIKQFTVLPGWKSILNRQRAYDYLIYSMTDHTDETMFEGVFQIPAGHLFKFNVDKINFTKKRRVQIEKWYNPVYKGYNGSFDEAACEFKNRFKQSVKEHLVADVPLGSALSGGMDSSAIVCEIDEILKEQDELNTQKTFSYISSDERYNEQKWINEVLSQTKVSPCYIHSNGDNAFKHAADIIWYNDEPNQSQSHLVSWQIYRAAKENKIKVLMSGQGADEYNSGYGAFMFFRWGLLLKKLKFRKLNYEITHSQTNEKLSLVQAYIKLGYFIVPKGLKRYLSRQTKYHQNLKSLISEKHLHSKKEHPFDTIPYDADSIFNIANTMLLHYPLQRYLHFDDRLSMSNSVEARVPFLDHRLVEFTTQLPADYLDSMGETKKMIKYGLKDILPEKIRNRKDKIGFITAEESWVKESHTKEFREMLEKSIKVSRGIIKPEALVYFDKLSKGKVPFDYTYWRLIIFGVWMEKFNVELSVLIS
jgi:asparagine synthase (glutamine-hydrolysing)